MRKHVMFVYFPGMDERSVTHGDSAMLLVVVVAFFFGGFFNVLVVCWGWQQEMVVKENSINTFITRPTG